jgi:hypothetical protein
MGKKSSTIRMLAKLGAITGAGVAAFFYVPTAAYQEATTVLASFAGVVVAALVPTMILAATILRPVSRGKNEFSRVRAAVAVQISFFSGLFLLTVVLAALLFVGSLLQWADVSAPIPTLYGVEAWTLRFPITKTLGACVVSISTLIAIQMTGFVHGIRSLFALHASNTEKELDRIILEQNLAVSRRALPEDPRRDFGQTIGELKH